MITGHDIVTEAREWLGTPWIHQASVKFVGCDCIGLVRGVALACGVPNAATFESDSRFKGYGRMPDPRMLLKACAEYFDPVEPRDMRLGDIPLMTFSTEPMHFGIVSGLSPNYVIHGLTMRGKVVEHRIDGTWQDRIMRGFRFRGVH